MTEIRPFRPHIFLFLWTCCRQRLTMPLGLLSLTLRSSARGLKAGVWIPVVLEWALLGITPAFAESPAVPVQWGGLAFFDQDSTLSVGGTVNRLGDADNPSLLSLRSASTLNETFGMSLVSISWTKQWDCSICEGITTKLTVGAVLMPEEAGRPQSDIHSILAQSRNRGLAQSVDSMDSLLNKWFTIQRNGDVAFGTSFVRPGTTLSKEFYERANVRGLAVPLDIGLPERFSLMGRVSTREQFMSLSYRYEGLKIEAWNQTRYTSTAGSDVGVAVAYSVEWDSSRFWDLRGKVRRTIARRDEAMRMSAQLK